MGGSSSVVSMLPSADGGFAILGTVADFTSWPSGEGAGAISAVVAERRRDLFELPESIDDRLGDLRWPIPTPPGESMLSFRLIGVDGCSAIGSADRGGCNGLVPKICDTPFRYERWMFSLGGDAPRDSGDAGGGAKNGEIDEMPLNAFESVGGLLDGYDVPSGRIHGVVDLVSTADKTGEVACETLFFVSSFFPSA